MTRYRPRRGRGQSMVIAQKERLAQCDAVLGVDHNERLRGVLIRCAQQLGRILLRPLEGAADSHGRQLD